MRVASSSGKDPRLSVITNIWVFSREFIEVMFNLIHGEQTDFLMTMSPHYNMQCLFMNMQLVPDNTGERAITVYTLMQPKSKIR